MKVIHARNINDAYRAGCTLLANDGMAAPSRNGPVLRIDTPVATTYSNPRERVLFDALRNANPFLHLFEALWMLNGRQDVKFVAEFNPRMREYSDNGETFHAAYGHRWRHFPIPSAMKPGVAMGGYDQLEQAIMALRTNPADRRVIIQMWNNDTDREYKKDLPCNLMIISKIRSHNALELTVFNRSNDIIWGAYGANVVQMTMLQEYLAAMIGCELGLYHQISVDFHAYMETPYTFDTFWPSSPDAFDPYQQHVAPLPLVTNPSAFDTELATLLQLIDRDTLHGDDLDDWTNPFFAKVCQPMWMAWRLQKTGALGPALLVLNMAQTAFPDVKNDWLLAGTQWLNRKIIRSEQRQLARI